MDVESVGRALVRTLSSSNRPRSEGHAPDARSTLLHPLLLQLNSRDPADRGRYAAQVSAKVGSQGSWCCNQATRTATESSVRRTETEPSEGMFRAGSCFGVKFNDSLVLYYAPVRRIRE